MNKEVKRIKNGKPKSLRILFDREACLKVQGGSRLIDEIESHKNVRDEKRAREIVANRRGVIAAAYNDQYRTLHVLESEKVEYVNHKAI